ncbi:hypothetical protein M3215_17675 [Bacillus cytotoxicus]|uniref:Uncharacterized protein n=1 Tax=Bacillus cytotoxicus TaxID=580165 RepID=A0ACC6A9L1_9BACI|nr:hypothetical protein [Bacillus cytotoxicus]
MYTEKELLEKLTMAQLRDEIHNTDKNHSKLKKEDLITMLQTEINGNEMRLQNLTRKYPHIFSLTPAKLEELLNITKTERKRWTNEGKLSVSHYESFHKWGKTHVYPMYNFYHVNKLTQENISLWRETYKEQIVENRKKATKKAVQTRNQNKAITKDFSFHIPFPLGSDFLPSPNAIVAIHHEEQEGLFRFGRALLDEEKIIFKEKSIIKYFEEAIQKYKHIYTECSSTMDLPPLTI